MQQSPSWKAKGVQLPANIIFVMAPQESLTAVFTRASHCTASVSWIQSKSATKQKYWQCKGSKNVYENFQYWLWLEWNMLAFLFHSFLPLTEIILSNDHSQWQSSMKQGFKHNSRKLTLSITMTLKYNLEGAKQPSRNCHCRLYTFFGK